MFSLKTITYQLDISTKKMCISIKLDICQSCKEIGYLKINQSYDKNGKFKIN